MRIESYRNRYRMLFCIDPNLRSLVTEHLQESGGMEKGEAILDRRRSAFDGQKPRGDDKSKT